MSIEISNKDLSKKVQTILKELGYEVKLGHVYELLAKLNGFNSYNAAKAKGVDLVPSHKNEREELLERIRRQGTLTQLGPVETTPFQCSVVASATIEYQQTLFAKDQDSAEKSFLQNIKENKVEDLRVVEPAVVSRDFEAKDVSIEVDTDKPIEPSCDASWS